MTDGSMPSRKPHWCRQLWGTGAVVPSSTSSCLIFQLTSEPHKFRYSTDSVWFLFSERYSGPQFCHCLLREFHNIFVCFLFFVGLLYFVVLSFSYFLLLSCSPSDQILATPLQETSKIFTDDCWRGRQCNSARLQTLLARSLHSDLVQLDLRGLLLR